MTSQTPAGWYPDPYGSPQLRWWDGSQWTDATHAQEQAPPAAPQPSQGGSDWAAHPANPTLQYGQPTQGQGQYGQPASGTTPFDQPPSGPNQPTPGASPYDQPQSQYGQPPSGASAHGQPPSGPNPYGQPPSGPNPYGQPTSGASAYGQPASGAYASPTPGAAPYGQPTQNAQYGQWGTTEMPGYGTPPPKKPGGPLPWILGGVGVLVVVALIVVAAVVVVNRTGGTTAQSSPPSADILPTPTESETAAPSDPPETGSTGQLPSVQDGRISDPQSGVSYQVPEGWKVPPFNQVNNADPTQQKWSSAVEAVSHEKYDGKGNWIGNVYTGQLHELYPYENAQGLGSTAGAVLSSFSGFYQLQHTRKIVENKAMKIGDKDAWLLKFELDFSKVSAEKGYKWKKENGAIVVMDRGQGERPALIYVSVPDNLGTDVVDQVIGSLKPA